MKKLVRVLLVFVVLGAVTAAAYQPALAYWKKRNTPTWRMAEITRGDIIAEVNATGAVKPVLSVHIGSFVSGPISELHVDFNQEVEKGDLLARVDPTIYAASVARDEGALAARRAEVDRITASLQLAKNNEQRAHQLREENSDFVSQAELDQVHFARMQQEAELKLAEAAVQQAVASLAYTQAQLGYTEIRAPVSGVVIDRKIDPGQTLAAQFQTPELFIVAPDMRKKMHVYASVDEADIGMIRSAQEKGRPVSFIVDAYPGESFEGTIEEIRFSSTETQNVVTYPVIVAAPNPDLKLLPGMTATISFEVEQRLKTLKIPNAALRFLPESRYVREADRKLLEGSQWERNSQDEPEPRMSAREKAKAQRDRSRRPVWIKDGDYLKAIDVVVGISDAKFTEMVSGGLKEHDKVVTGIEPKKPWGT